MIEELSSSRNDVSLDRNWKPDALNGKRRLLFCHFLGLLRTSPMSKSLHDLSWGMNAPRENQRYCGNERYRHWALVTAFRHPGG
jgi:hypothetical protein